MSPSPFSKASLALAFSILAPALGAQVEWHRVDGGDVPLDYLLGPYDNIAYDPIRRVVVMHGGSPRQVWEWNGISWAAKGNDGIQIGNGFMVWDPAGGQVLSFGGSNIFARFDMGAWDGKGWRKLAPVNRPPDRYWHAMAADTARKRVVLFGGSSVDFQTLGDTWEWDGVDWTQKHPAHGPAARVMHAMAYDPIRGRVVLFGGLDQTPGQGAVGFTDTWEWDGTDWIERRPAISPPPTTSYNFHLLMTYDHLRSRTVLLRERDGRAEFWEWDGEHWEPQPASGAPLAAMGWSMAYDQARRQTLLITLGPLWRTWAYSPTYAPGLPSATEDDAELGLDEPGIVEYGTGVAGSGNITPKIGSGGQLAKIGNSSFEIQLTDALGGTPCFIAGSLEAAETPLFGMTLYVGPYLRWQFLTSGASGVPGAGTATLPIPIPNDPALIGLTTYWQGFVSDFGSPLAIGVSHTRGLAVTVSR